MNRCIAGLVLAGLVASVAQADIRPPGSFRTVVRDYKIETEKEYPEYEFFTVTDKVKAVKIEPKAPLEFSGAAGGGKFKTTLLFAVPKGAGKSYKSEKEYHKAIMDEKVPGQLGAGIFFSGTIEVKVNDTRKKVLEVWRVEKIEPKGEGFVVSPSKDAKKPPESSKKEEEEPSESPAALAPRGANWIAGVALSLGILLTGLWFTTRYRGRSGPDRNQ